MRPHVSGTERVGFSKARHSWEPSCSSTTGKFSPFRTLRKASALIVHWTDHTFLSHKNPRADTFLRQPSYAVQPTYGITRGSPIREYKLIVACQKTAFLLTLCSKAIVRTFLATNASQQDFNLRRVVLLWYCSHLIGA